MSLQQHTSVGLDALQAKGWWKSHQWLVLRRASQLSLLALFLLGPWAGLWIVKGNLASSLTLGMLPLTDPYVLLQSLSAGHWPLATAITGAGIVLAFYGLVGGRAYCSWVCPIKYSLQSVLFFSFLLALKIPHDPSVQRERLSSCKVPISP